MATALAKITLGGTSGAFAQFQDGVDNDQRLLWAYGTCAVDANPATYATGGLAIVKALNTALNGWAQEQIKVSPLKTGDTGPTPLFAWFISLAGSGFVYQWNQATNKFQIFTSNGAAPNPLLEFTNAAAIPAGVSGDTIFFVAAFVRK